MVNEKRLIDANELKSKIQQYHNSLKPRYISKLVDAEIADIQAIIDEAPTVDAVEVVHGRWKRTPVSGTLYCGVCDKIPECQVETDYCPNCGAKMDGGNEDG